MDQDGGATADGARSGFITLAQPRPGTARRQNEYLESPPLRLPEPPRPPKEAAAPVTAQPKNPKAGAPLPPPAEPPPPHAGDSIICRQCRRCRCEACRAPRRLPSAWICNNECLCSAETALDYCSCMCCVKGLFYHWAKDHETDASCADRPCSCSPHARLLRWGCLALLALPLPCLCCYWPARACVAGGERCYARCAGRGCRCAPHRTEKRLLDASAPADL